MRESGYFIPCFPFVIDKRMSTQKCGVFIGEDYERVKLQNKHGLKIDAALAKIEVHSFYCDFHVFLVKPSDPLGDDRHSCGAKRPCVVNVRRFEPMQCLVAES